MRTLAKALWLIGEMGLAYPAAVQEVVPVIASFLDSPVPLLRERAINALGRIGRGGYYVIESYWLSLFRFRLSSREDKSRTGSNAIYLELMLGSICGFQYPSRRVYQGPRQGSGRVLSVSIPLWEGSEGILHGVSDRQPQAP